MVWHDHYFILDESHEPVEVTQHEWIHWGEANNPIRETRINKHARVRTTWAGMVDDVSMPGPPSFAHYIEGPGIVDKWVKTLRYDDAIARHERIVEWLRKRVARFECLR